MRTIFFASNMQNDLFPGNTRTSFETFTNTRDLSYIASGDIELAIKSITFDNTREDTSTKEGCLALKTNLTPDTISSFGWDKIVSVFNVHDDGVSVIEFRNPTFFPTTLKQLARAKFWIVDLATNDPPNVTLGSPTFIEVVVKKQTLRMKAPFHILLDSSCETSTRRFTNNGNMDFVVQLPKRMEFERDWMLCLKSIHLTNEFTTIHDCWISVDGEKITLEDGFTPTQYGLLLKLNKFFRGKLNFTLRSDGMKIKTDPRLWRRKKMKRKVGDTEEEEEIDVEISRNLQHILGLRYGVSDIIKMKKDTEIKSFYKPNIYALIPSHFIVCCDLVESSLLGGQSVQILKYFPLDKTRHTQKMIDIDFNNNDYVKLERKKFDRIHVRILSITGEPVKCNENVPTRMQLLFLNTNSQ